MQSVALHSLAQTSLPALIGAVVALALLGIGCDAMALWLLGHRSIEVTPWPRRTTVVASLAMVAGGLSILMLEGMSLEAVAAVALAAVLLCLSLTDLEARIIPNCLVGTVVLLNVGRTAAAWALGGVPAALTMFADSLLGAAVVAIPLAVSAVAASHLLGETGMGGGDVKLLVALGLYVGWRSALPLLALACLLGIAGAPATSRWGQREAGERMGTTFPFGPAIALACMIVLALQQVPVGSYLQIL